MHRHQCGYGAYGFDPTKGCGFVWEHEEPTGLETKAEYATRHVCPNCGNPRQLYRVGEYENMESVGSRILLTVLAAALQRLEESKDERLFKQRK